MALRPKNFKKFFLFFFEYENLSSEKNFYIYFLSEWTVISPTPSRI